VQIEKITPQLITQIPLNFYTYYANASKDTCPIYGQDFRGHVPKYISFEDTSLIVGKLLGAIKTLTWMSY